MPDPRLQPNQATEVLKPPAESDSLRPEPEPLFGDTPISLDTLRALAGRSIVTVSDLTKRDVVQLCRFAALLESIEVAPYRPLDGKIVITAFFEASTRTRTSFESATLRLGGNIISIPEGQITGQQKGESLEDTGEMFNAYADVVVMRHTETDAPDRIQNNLRIPLINAGNGSGEHPTQALADWYALLKWRPGLASADVGSAERLHLGILGTPGSMRAVKSFLLMSLLFKPAIRKVTVISELADPFGTDVADAIIDAGVEYAVTNDIQGSLDDLDVIYMNSIAFLGDSYKTLDTRYQLDDSSGIKPGAVILHPLARLQELSTTLDNTEHNLYFSQAHGAVFVRQALLTCVADRIDRLAEPIRLAVKG